MQVGMKMVPEEVGAEPEGERDLPGDGVVVEGALLEMQQTRLLSENGISKREKDSRMRARRIWRRDLSTFQSLSNRKLEVQRETTTNPIDAGLLNSCEKIRRRCRIGNTMVDKEIDKSWVVPYFPKVTRAFDCHINAEFCISRVGSLKNLLKYVCKGRVREKVSLAPEGPNHVHDKIENYVDNRYVSASQAIWSLPGYTYIDQKPPVIRLDVNHTGHQNLYFEEGEMREAAARASNGTKLLLWFKSNQDYPNAQDLSYVDFTRRFSWQKGKWKSRGKFKLSTAQLALSDLMHHGTTSRARNSWSSAISTWLAREKEKGSSLEHFFSM